ncbi:MAG: M28 family peptidase [Gemmatimonadetes bacterium]|nr:M28 family peptidase [Gemmatimonadota bacterium]
MNRPTTTSNGHRRVMRRRRTRLLLALATLAAAPDAAAQGCPRADAPADDPLVTVRYLASDALEGRRAGSSGEACAADYVAGEFQRLGLVPGGEDGTFFQRVPLASAANPHAPAGTGRNVVAILEGADPALRQEVLVIGAHVDHLGRGGFGSLAPDEKDAIHNGADDNASGIAALLQIARELARGPRPARSLVFVAFTGEELGLLGSAYYAAHPVAPLERTRAMLNLDMVGRLGSKPVLIYGTGTALEWGEIVGRAAREEKIDFADKPDGFGPSDHTSFYARDIPVLHFFTNVHEDYHRPSDDWQKIDRDGIRRIAQLVVHIARDVAARPAALALQRGAGTPPGTGGPGYGAYLGTIPDFTPVERGVRLTGVRAGSPAAAAGIRAGDIIIRFEQRDIADLQAFTDALRAHKPGDTVRITVLRDGAEVILDATLGSRSAGN